MASKLGDIMDTITGKFKLMVLVENRKNKSVSLFSNANDAKEFAHKHNILGKLPAVYIKIPGIHLIKQ
jgi:hypothetical protein